jgi:plasmid replication initiation protein
MIELRISKRRSEMSSNKDLMVTKHNSLIEASYKLSLNEQRLVLLCIARLDTRKPLPKDNLFTITAKEFAKNFGIEEKHAYTALDEAASSLYERDIKTFDGKYRERFRWVCGVKYHDKEGKVTLGFSNWVTPYLTMLHERFASYKLKQIAGLKSVYSIRLFEFLTQFKTTGKLLIELDRFKDRLEIKDEYKRFYNLRMRVIEPAVKELMEKSNLEINWKPIKSGKTIKQLEFSFYER